MGMLAQIMHAVPGTEQKLLPVDHLQNLAVEHENQLFTGMLHGLGLIRRRDIENERRKFMPRKFRPDLFFKLAVIPLSVPPLRERSEDIIPLAEHFLKELHSVIKDGPKKISANAKKLLEKYPWPGNVGELRNAIERAFALAGTDAITEKELPPKLRDGTGSLALTRNQHTEGTMLPVGEQLSPFVREMERKFIRATLESSGGSKEQAASILGISLATLYRKMDA